MPRPIEQTPEQAKAAAGGLVAWMTTISNRATTVADILAKAAENNHFGPTVEAAVKGKF